MGSVQSKLSFVQSKLSFGSKPASDWKERHIECYILAIRFNLWLMGFLVPPIEMIRGLVLEESDQDPYWKMIGFYTKLGLTKKRAHQAEMLSWKIADSVDSSPEKQRLLRVFPERSEPAIISWINNLLSESS